MTFLNPLDMLIPKIPFSFFANVWVWVTSEARGSVSVGFLGSRHLSPFWGRGGSSQGALSTPPPHLEAGCPSLRTGLAPALGPSATGFGLTMDQPGTSF